ncbi:MAG: SIS domain-containing protein [Acidimicrobiales bacterium]|jgi:fructoselysine-6-P-deglycase FrlB-like protein
MSMIEQELCSQPDVWLEASDLAAAVRKDLPASGARVAVFGCGTSFYMAQAAARLREDAGQGETDAFAASEFPSGRSYDLHVAISRSGTTTEVIDVLEHIRGCSLLITADPDQPAARSATRTISLAFADEESVVQTRFATAWVALWRAHLGQDVAALAAQAREALGAALPSGLGTYRQFVFIGHGAAAAFAAESALKLREAAGAWTEAYAAMEFRHGPISAAGPHTLVWSLDPLDPSLSDDIAATGAAMTQGLGDPMVELLRVQRAAVELAALRGLDPDRPRHLSRSVILASPAAAGSP